MTAPVMLLWAAAGSEAGLEVAHQHTTLTAARAEADQAMASGLLGEAGLDVYVTLDGRHWHVAEHRYPRALLPADLATPAEPDAAPLPRAAAAAPSRSGGSWLATGVLVVGCVLVVLFVGYSGWVLASSPVAACGLLWPRRALSGWSCWCGTYNDSMAGVCRGCGRGRG